MKQGSDEWRQARCGMFTASRLSDLMAKTKSGYGAGHRNYIADLLVERMTGEPIPDGYKSQAMVQGNENEAEARAVYEFESDCMVEEVGFIVHPNLPYTGASPDGLVGDDGMVEIKCPFTATHVETLLYGKLPGHYFKQIQWGLECTERQWCDYISYDKRLQKPELVLFIKRVDRDQAFIDEAIKEVMEAENELQILIEKLEAL